MKPDEVVQLLNGINIPVSVPTLARYVRDGLISEPERGGHGRGGGRWTEYSLYGVVEAATAWKLLNGKIEIPGEAKQTIRFSPGMVKLVRSDALREFGLLIAGTEGVKFINPSFISSNDEPYPTSYRKDFEKMYLVLEEEIKNMPNVEDSRFPSWFPTRAYFLSQLDVCRNLVSMLQNAYLNEYEESILDLLPKVKDIV